MIPRLFQRYIVSIEALLEQVNTANVSELRCGALDNYYNDHPLIMWILFASAVDAVWQIFFNLHYVLLYRLSPCPKNRYTTRIDIMTRNMNTGEQFTRFLNQSW